jgi:hypothetical protein
LIAGAPTSTTAATASAQSTDLLVIGVPPLAVSWNAIGRYLGPVTEAKPPQDDHETDSDRRAANIFLAVFFVLMIGCGIWLVDALLEQRDLDNCLSQGRRNCAAPIETQSIAR